MKTGVPLIDKLEAPPVNFSRNLAKSDEAGTKDLRTRALAIRSLALSGALDSERLELDEETRRRLAEMGYAEGFGEGAP